MSRHHFQFKQFKVEQEHCAMKVCTDACLFGAWVVELLKNTSNDKVHSILDIGSGTGLLSLILAQEINCRIDSIEIDEAAAGQAAANFATSAFSEKLNLIHSDIRKWNSVKTYDCIISNPPFFENDLKSTNQKKNLALHSVELGLTELMQSIKIRLSSDGFFTLLLPYHRKDEMIRIANQNGFYLFKTAAIKQTNQHHYFRVFLAFNRKSETILSEEIIIQNNRVYTDRFISLLKNYYLAF